MRLRRIGLSLVVLGLVCLPAPFYLSALAEVSAPPPRTSQVYVGHAVDIDTPSGRETVVEHHASTVAVGTYRISETYSTDEYRTPNRTRRRLETALSTGTATTDAPGTKADLRRIARNYRFVYDFDTHNDQYYRLRVRDNGSMVSARNVSKARLANVIVTDETIEYRELSPTGRHVVDRILANSTSDGGSDYPSGYRPRSDTAFADRLPALVRKDETLYSITADGHVDDFGPGFSGFLAGLVVAAAGGISIVIGGVLYLIWR